MTRTFLSALLALLLAPLALAGTASYNSTILADTPIAFWSFDEITGTTAADSSGTAQNGTYQNCTLGVASAFPNLGTCAQFNGTNARVRIPFDLAFNLGTGDFAVELWYRTALTTPGNLFTNRAGAVDFEIISNGTGTANINGTHNGTLPSGSAAINTWHHVVYSRAAGITSLYVDGVFVASAADTASLSAGTNMYVGSNVNFVYFTGTIDEVAYYGAALSAARVAAHYQAALTNPGAPTAVADGPYNGTEETTLTVNTPGLLANDTDPQAQALTASLVTQSTNGVATVNANGSFSFVPAANFTGTTTFTYRANDGTNNSLPATVTLNFANVPDNPVAAPDTYTAVRNTPLIVSAIAGSTVTEDVLPLSTTGWHYYNALSLANRDLGTAWRQPGYTESADWVVGSTELGYGDGDEAGGVSVADDPIAGYDTATTERFATYYFRRDFQLSDLASVTAVELMLIFDDAGVVFFNGAEVARTSNLPTAAVTPDLAWDYFVTGATSENTTATFNIPVSSLASGTNLAASEIHQAAATSSDMSFNLRIRVTRAIPGGLLFNDTDPDPGSTLTVASNGQPAHGAVTVNANGTFTYTPANQYVGSDSFTYVVQDETGRTATGTASITVGTGPDVAPIAKADSYSAVEDQVLTVAAATGLLANDTDAESDPFTAVIATNPLKGSVNLAADGSFTYTPNLNVSGADSFTYTAFDGKNSPPATVTINIAAVNDAPVAVADSYLADPGQTITISAPGVLGNDTDVDSAATSFTAVLNTAATSGSVTLNANGGFNYTAPAARGTYTFTYRTNDGLLNSAPATVTIVVNSAPIAGADAYPLVEDNILTVNAPGVLGNDLDPESQPLTAQLVSQPASGSVVLNANGSFAYTPPANFAGPVSFTYKALDGVRESAPATVTITVSNVNDAPVASNNSYTALVDSTLTVAAPGVLDDDTDADAGTTLTAALISGVTHGVLNFNANGGFTYTPALGYTGPDGFTYRVSDGQVFSNTATVSIRVSDPVRDVKISEIMFRPAPLFPEPEAEEWIELQNTEPLPAVLSGWTLSSGVSFTFAAGTTIPPNGRLVVVANVAAFKAKYPGVTNITGPWVGGLANNGERITLSDAAGNSVNSVAYATEGDWGERYIEAVFNGWDWRNLADGGGRSLELRNFSVDSDNGQNWGPSSVVNGTPGAPNSLAVTQSAPLISKVRHRPAIPASTDSIKISCELKDEAAAEYLAATAFWRDATTTTPGAWNSQAMTGDGHGAFFAIIPPQSDKTLIEFYISATDGSLTRTWPAPSFLANGTASQTANCQLQVDNEIRTSTDTYYRLTLTAAENTAYNTVATSSDRVFNQTLIITRGAETDIHYRAGMRIRGNSSRSYQFRPLRITVPNEDPLSDGSVKFNINPKASPLQYLGQRTMQVMGLAASDAIPVELRRNGVESTTSTGTTPDYGKWTRVEAEDSSFVSNHFGSNDGGNFYKKIDNSTTSNFYWRSTGFTVPAAPDGEINGWTKSNNSSANDWSDLTGFFTVWQAAAAPHFPTASPTDVSQSTGGRLQGVGAWNSTAFTDAEMDSIATVADLDYWARWFAVMTILQDIETDLSNGVDDDYSAYFLPGTDGLRRMTPIAHDLDTILGQGDTATAFNGRGLYDMCDNAEVFRSLLPLFGNNTSAGNAAFRTLYHQKLREAYGSWLNASTASDPNPPYHQFIDNHLAGWVPATVIASLKTFATQRQAYLLGLIGSAAVTPPAATSTAVLNTAHGAVMISEILADNVASVNVGGAFPDIIELYNSGAAAADLGGRSITDDPAQPLKFVFPAGTTIAAGGYLVLYADGLATAGHLPFSLNNSGESVVLYNSAANGGGVLDSITFGLQVPDFSIGRTGATLQTWTLTTPSFGAANTAIATFGAPGGLFINEWLANPDFRLSGDFAELYNPAANPVALGGMSFSDDVLNAPTRFAFPPLSFLPAASFTRFDFLGSNATPGNAKEVSFRLGATFGNLALIGQNGTIVNTVDLVSQAPDASTGRSTDGGSTIVTFAPPSSLPTPGASNTTPPANILNLVNNLRITEIHFNPINGTAFEFIELTNIGATALELLGVRFVEGIDFVFPSYSLAPGAYVVVARDPSKYPALPVVGPYGGALDNSGETIGLMLPAPRDTYIQRFAYKDSWEIAADGGGSSLQFYQTSTYAGNWDQGEFWQSGPPTAGTGMPFSISAGPDLALLLPGYAPFNGTLSPGSANNIVLAWSKLSGPGTVTFTNTTQPDTSANFSQAGIYTLRLASTSSAGTTTDDVAVTVQDTYSTWAARVLAGQSAGNQTPASDPDKDGISNALEFVLGTNPLAPSLAGQITTVNGHLGLTCTFSKLIDPAVQVIGELSLELINWTGNATLSLLSETPTTSSWLAQDPELLSAHSRRFLRLRVVLP